MNGEAGRGDDRWRLLRQQTWEANLRLRSEGLVKLTWGNVSVRHDDGTFAIKPSGMPYDTMAPGDMVVVDVGSEAVVDGARRPSTDTRTHAVLYRAFSSIGAIVHMHSIHATAFAQARVPIPLLGTTHADHFSGPVPVTRPLTEAEVDEGYELHTGEVIVAHLRGAPGSELSIPAMLVAGHAPFVWGATAVEAVDNAVALEACAQMVAVARMVARDLPPLEPHVVRAHHNRKHGPGAYYGQGLLADQTSESSEEHS